MLGVTVQNLLARVAWRRDLCTPVRHIEYIKRFDMRSVSYLGIIIITNYYWYFVTYCTFGVDSSIFQTMYNVKRNIGTVTLNQLQSDHKRDISIVEKYTSVNYYKALSDTCPYT